MRLHIPVSKRVCGLNPDNQQQTQKKPTPVLAHHPEELWEPALFALNGQRKDAPLLLGLAAKVHGVDELRLPGLLFSIQI